MVTEISTLDSWDGGTSINTWDDFTQTFGQTFTPPNDSSLTSFELYIQSLDMSVLDEPYSAYLYEWDDANLTVTGPSLWNQDGFSRTSPSGFTSTVFDLAGSPQLTAGTEYVFFVSTQGYVQGPGRFGIGGMFDNPYSDGRWVFNRDDYTSTWFVNGGIDLAFRAVFLG